jgi:hypothetical protein
VWHQCSQCDQLLNIRYSFPTCTFLRPGKPKSISKQHDGLWMGTINPSNIELNSICYLLALLGGATIVVVSRLRVNKQWLWDICLYRLTPRLTQSPTQQSYNWYSMERCDTFTECWGKNVCMFMSKLPAQLHGVLLWHGNKLTFTFIKINTNSGGKP